MAATRPSVICLSPPPALSIEHLSTQVQRLISRSQDVVSASRRAISRSREIYLSAELSRAIMCCTVAKSKHNCGKRLEYFLVAEATSAKFYRLISYGEIADRTRILALMERLEKELGGQLYLH